MKNVDKFIQYQKKIREFLRNKLIWTQIKQKKQINKHRHVVSKLRIKNKIMFDSRYINIIKFNRKLNYKNFDFYEIVRTINNIVYKFNLSKSIKKIFLIFHFWLLHLKNNNSFFKQKNHEYDFIIIDVENNKLWKIKKNIEIQNKYENEWFRILTIKRQKLSLLLCEMNKLTIN